MTETKVDAVLNFARNVFVDTALKVTSPLIVIVSFIFLFVLPVQDHLGYFQSKSLGIINASPTSKNQWSSSSLAWSVIWSVLNIRVTSIIASSDMDLLTNAQFLIRYSNPKILNSPIPGILKFSNTHQTWASLQMRGLLHGTQQRLHWGQVLESSEWIRSQVWVLY